MVDICSYVLILASVVLFGYSLSRLIDGFSTVQKKMQDYRQMLAEYEAPPDATRRINTLQNGFLALGYVVLAHLAGFTLWFLALMAAKFTLSCCFSDKLHCLVIHECLLAPCACSMIGPSLKMPFQKFGCDALRCFGLLRCSAFRGDGSYRLPNPSKYPRSLSMFLLQCHF